MRHRLALLIITSVLLGCASPSEDKPIVHIGSDVCAECRMSVEDAAYAAVIRPATGDDHVFDSIECTLRYRRRHLDETAGVWLPDLETAGLHPAEQLTVVRADFPSPMGGGYAAFLDAERAREEARGRDGVAGTFDAFVSGTVSREEAGS